MNPAVPFSASKLCRIGLLVASLLSACAPVTTATPSETAAVPPAAPTLTLAPSATLVQPETAESEPTLTLAPTMTPDTRPQPEDWQIWPVLPDLSPAMLEVYTRGQALGRDPQVFSVLGDCQSSPTYFLSLYDEDRYTLSEADAELQKTIEWYAGSFSHRGITVRNGMTAPGALNPRWADPEFCEPKETPIACELRQNNPSLMLISLGTNWLPATTQESYIAYLETIVQTLLDEGVIPVFSTKADNLEGDHRRNLAMAQVAYDYQLPLWNFWAVVKDLPNGGLDDTRKDAYLNYRGWDARNLSALQLLAHLHQQLPAQ